MAAQAFLLLACFLAVLLLLAQPLGRMMTAMVLDRPGGKLESALWRICGVRQDEMNWRQYLLAILLFNLLGVLFLFAVLLLQGMLPLNPQGFPGLSWHLALNTAISFVSNTNWQSYAGESTISYFSSMVGLTVQNFLSAATGMAVVFALMRGFTRHSTQA